MSPLTLDAIRRVMGDLVHVIPVTGRPVPSALRIGRVIGAPLVVALGGAAIARVSDGRVMWTADPIPGALVSSLWDGYAEMGARLHLHGASGWAVTHDDEATARYAERHGMPAPHVGQPSADVLLVELVNGRTVLPMSGVHAVPARTAHGSYCDITAAGVHKGTGLDRVVDLMGIRWRDVWTIGDGGNDEPMMERARLSIVVGEHPAESLLSVASHHVPASAEDGAVGTALLALLYEDATHTPHVRALR